jgi:hypothetical protein
LKQQRNGLRIQQKNAARDFPPVPAAQPYCAGALVAGAAGALVAGASGAGAAGALAAGASGAGAAGALVADIVGGVPVSASFLQPVNSPTQTNPDTATNDNNFFILV